MSEPSEDAKLLKELHADATRYLHSRSDLSETALIARLAYLMGEMKAPVNALVEHFPSKAQGEKE